MKTKTIIIIIISLLGVVALGINGKALLEKRKDEVAKTPLPMVDSVSIPVTKATQDSLKKEVAFLAQIASDKTIKLSTKLAGYVQKVFVQESQKVKKGEVLVKIDAVELRSNMSALNATLQTQKSDLALAKNIHRRNKKLYRVGGLPKEKLELSSLMVISKTSMIKNTKEKLKQLQHQLSYLKIKAPFDGIVDRLFLQEGDLAVTGKPILSLSNGKKKLLFAYAPTQSQEIKKGLKVFKDTEEIGEIKALYTTSNNGLLNAEILLTKTVALPVGSSLNIKVLVQEANGCLLPTNTLVHKKEGTFVMAYERGNFTPFKVEVLMQEEHKVLLLECPNTTVAYGNEVKLAQLPVYDRVEVLEEK